MLGGGGTAGLAYHAGVLLALEQDYGWDPRTAELIIGTSAGSIVGALLRSGVSTDDLAAWCSEVDALPGRDQFRDALDAARDATMSFRRPTFTDLTPSPQAVWSVLTGRTKMTQALMAQLPFGLYDAAPVLSNFATLTDQWPERPLWLTAVGVHDGRRVAFGRCDRSSPAPPLADALAASCAIPGLYRRVDVDGRRYVDGGVHSGTNADLLTHDAAPPLDLAVIIAPMSIAPSSRSMRPSLIVRERSARKLCDERRRCSQRGLSTVALEPDPAVAAVMGINLLDSDRAPRVLTGAFLSTAESIPPDVAAVLRAAASARPHPTELVANPRHGASLGAPQFGELANG